MAYDQAGQGHPESGGARALVRCDQRGEINRHLQPIVAVAEAECVVFLIGGTKRPGTHAG